MFKSNNSDEKQTKNNSRRAAVVYGGLFGFGIGYNKLVSELEEKGLDEGYTSDLVVAGTAVTLLATLPLLGWRCFFMVLGAFAASGIPMSIGAKVRYRRWRQREREGYGNQQRTARPSPAAWLQASGYKKSGGSGAPRGIKTFTRN